MEILRGLVRIIREEAIAIFFVLLFMGTIQYSFLFFYGWFGLIFDPPSLGDSVEALQYAREARDSDGDGLPDIIELAPAGKKVFYEGVEIGRGTNTDPFKMDSDGDLFTDAAEDKSGTDPNNFFDFGWFWIVWGSFFMVLFYMKYVHKPDRVKEYIQNEALLQSEGSKKGKYAYGSRNIKDRAEIIKDDPRFKELTEIYENPVKKRSVENKGLRYLVIAFVLVFSIVIGQVFVS